MSIISYRPLVIILLNCVTLSICNIKYFTKMSTLLFLMTLFLIIWLFTDFASNIQIVKKNYKICKKKLLSLSYKCIGLDWHGINSHALRSWVELESLDLTLGMIDWLCWWCVDPHRCRHMEAACPSSCALRATLRGRRGTITSITHPHPNDPTRECHPSALKPVWHLCVSQHPSIISVPPRKNKKTA